MTVRTDFDAGVRTIRLDRPEKKNAITQAMYEGVVAALAAGEAADEVRVHLITGSDGIFTAGNDIGDFLAMAQGEIHDSPVVQLLRILPKLEKPLVAAVDGPAVGIGTTLLLHCDLVFASDRARFAAPFLNLGLVPEAGSSLLLPQRIGHVKAFEMLCLGAEFSANEAMVSGLINRVVTPDALAATADAAARRLAAMPPEALRLSRNLLRDEADRTAIAARIEAELTLFKERLRSAEAREAFSAFLEKRPPNFG